jgi:hypothetical protein
MKARHKGAISIAFALIAMIARPQIVFAQNPPAPIRGSWEGLKAIPPGDKVAVTLRNGQTLKGRLVSVSDTVLTIEKGKNTIDVTRADALKVYRGLRKSTTRATRPCSDWGSARAPERWRAPSLQAPLEEVRIAGYLFSSWGSRRHSRNT